MHAKSHTSHAAPSQIEPKARPKGQRTGFLMQFFRTPGQVGAIAPTSKWVGRKMTQGLHLDRAKLVVEYGPGNGTLTDEFVKAIGPRTRFFAIELSTEMAELFRERHPSRRVYVGSAADIGRYAALEGFPAEHSVDVVVSALPWANFPPLLCSKILAATTRALKPGGRFVTIAYTGGELTRGGRRLAKLLERHFATVEKTPPVLRNVPPAFLYRCTTKA